MPSGWVLADLLTRRIKLKCIKSIVLDTLPFWNTKDLDPDQTGSVSKWKAGSESVYWSGKQDPGSGSVSKRSGSATMDTSGLFNVPKTISPPKRNSHSEEMIIFPLYRPTNIFNCLYFCPFFLCIYSFILNFSRYLSFFLLLLHIYLFYPFTFSISFSSTFSYFSLNNNGIFSEL